MSTVRCPLGSHRTDLADGRALAPGETATDVDVTDPHNAAAIAERRLLIVPDDETATTIADVLAQVGDDRDRAAEALAAERSRGDGARTTLVQKLESILTTQQEATP